MSITRVCCSKELAGSCIHCWGNRYCTNPESVTYDWLDGFCTGYVNREIFTKHFKEVEGFGRESKSDI